MLDTCQGVVNHKRSGSHNTRKWIMWLQQLVILPESAGSTGLLPLVFKMKYCRNLCGLAFKVCCKNVHVLECMSFFQVSPPPPYSIALDLPSKSSKSSDFIWETEENVLICVWLLFHSVRCFLILIAACLPSQSLPIPGKCLIAPSIQDLLDSKPGSF